VEWPGAPKVRVARKLRMANSDEMYDISLQIAKLLSWPQLRARITRTIPIDGPILVSVRFEPANNTSGSVPPPAGAPK